MLTLRMLAAVALVAPGLAVGSGPAGAAVRLCQGEEVTIEAAASNTTVRGTNGPDVIDGIGRNDLVIEGLGGDDVICDGPGSAVEIRGGAGNDRVEGSYLVDGGPGDDVVRLLGNGRALGGEGDDRLEDVGASWTQSVTMTPGPGDDTIVGSATDPTVLVFGGTTGVRIAVAEGTADGEGHDTFTRVGRFVGSRASDVFVGSDGDDIFDGEPGWFGGLLGDDIPTGAADLAYGGAGRDSISLKGRAYGEDGGDVLRLYGDRSVGMGGAGDDRIEGASGRRCFGRTTCRGRLDGGAGRDTVTFESSGGHGARVNLTTGRARQGAYVSSLSGFEDADGTKRADVLIGDTRPNTLRGGFGNDVLRGRGGPDRLIGEVGRRDRAVGGHGRDRCSAEIRRSC